MTGYTKLFGSIVGSTVWREDSDTRVVWITMLALADQDGVVEASLPGLADLSRVSIEQTKAALAKFMEPDEYSRTPDYGGRRIEKVDGGWRILNHAKYRDKMSAEYRKARARLRQQRHRAGQNDRDDVTQKRDTSVTTCDMSHLSPHTEADTEAEANADAKEPAHPFSSSKKVFLRKKENQAKERKKIATADDDEDDLAEAAQRFREDVRAQLNGAKPEPCCQCGDSDACECPCHGGPEAAQRSGLT